MHYDIYVLLLSVRMVHRACTNECWGPIIEREREVKPFTCNSDNSYHYHRTGVHSVNTAQQKCDSLANANIKLLQGYSSACNSVVAIF